MRAFRPRDIFHLRRLQDVAISPDGEAIAYGLQQPDATRGGYTTRIYRLGSPDISPRPITRGPQDRRPSFSPDGLHIAFLRRTVDADQLHLLPLHGGEALQLTSLRHGVDAYAWGPHGRQIAAVAPVGPDGPTVRQLYRFDLDGTWRQLSDDDLDHRDPVVAPDGRSIACLLVRADGTAIALAPTDGGPWRLVAPWQRLWAHPVFAPDGGSLYAIGAVAGEAPGIWRLPLGGQPPQPLGPPPWPLADAAGGPGCAGAQTRLFVTGDGQSLLTLLRQGRQTALGRCSLPAGRWQVEGPHERRIQAFAASTAGDRVALIAGPADQPPEAQLRDESGRVALRSDHHDLFLADVTFAPVRMTAGPTDAGLLLPQAPGGGKPLVVLLGDLPDPATGGSSSLLGQALCGHGLAVLSVPLTEAAALAWAHDPPALRGHLQELAAGAAAHSRTLDVGRLGLCGVGPGGYLALLLLGESGTFQAVATLGAATDLLGLWGTGNLGTATFLRDLPPPWQDPGVYLRLSPLLQAGAMEAPLLLLHGQDDRIVPPQQALELRAALESLGRKVRCEIYPGLGHEPLALAPLRLQAQILDETSAWLRDHLAR